MSLLEKAANLLNRNRNGSQDLWQLLKDLYVKSSNKNSYVRMCFDYWEGKLKNTLKSNVYFSDQESSNDNIIEGIVETKISNLLDAQFTISVVPNIGSFYDINMIKNAQDVADILNDEIINIFTSNHQDQLDEQIARNGEVCGFGVSRVDWDDTERVEGNVKITNIAPEKCVWSKDSDLTKSTVFAYEEVLSVYEAKKRYAMNEDGSFDEKKCELIDRISEVTIGDKDRAQGNAVINYINESNDTSGIAFTGGGGAAGIQAGRVVRLITMFLIDTSCYAPEESDSQEVADVKTESIRAFPNGRKVTFSLNSAAKIILEDIASPESFKSLGNIDVYNPITYKDLSGKSPLSDIFPIQDRINGLYTKYREKITWDFDTVIVDEDFGMEDSSLIRGPVTRVKDYNTNSRQISEVMTNQGVEKGVMILDAIDRLKKAAYEKAKMNETMLFGSRQTGTTSGDQVERLQESPLVNIRRQQKNFKDWKISVAEKCLRFIVSNYNQQRLIKLSAGIDGADIARIDTNTDTGQKSITLLKEVNGAISTIKSIPFNDKWEFAVEATAGMAIPRSRKELAQLTDKIVTSPIMQQENIDLIDMYLQAQDYPLRRSLVKMLRDLVKKKADTVPPALSFIDLIHNKDWGKAAADIFKSIEGFPLAQGQLLKGLGLDPTTGTIASLPASAVTAKTSATEIASITPTQISEKPNEVAFGYEQADKIERGQRGEK